MSTDIEYRLVIDVLTNENIGVAKIDLGKWKGTHWIVDQDGDDRKSYKFRRIDEAKYDTAIAFETHPVLKVKYKRYLHVFEDMDDMFGVFLLISASFSVACSYILGTVIMFSDLVPVLGNSGWYQTGYWLITVGTIISGGGMIASIVSDNILGTHSTKKDELVKKWLKFKEESEFNSEPDN